MHRAQREALKASAHKGKRGEHGSRRGRGERDGRPDTDKTFTKAELTSKVKEHFQKLDKNSEGMLAHDEMKFGGERRVPGGAKRVKARARLSTLALVVLGSIFMAERKNTGSLIPVLIAAASAAAPCLPAMELLATIRLRLPWYARLPLVSRVGIGSDRHGDLRARVACALLRDFSPEHRSLIRFILEQEIAHAAHAYNDCYVVTLMACCLMLFKLGHAEDALLISDAKACCFDAQFLVDGFLMCGAGVDETLRHLRALGTAEADEVADYLERTLCQGALQDLAAKAAVYEANFRLTYAEALES